MSAIETYNAHQERRESLAPLNTAALALEALAEDLGTVTAHMNRGDDFEMTHLDAARSVIRAGRAAKALSALLDAECLDRLRKLADGQREGFEGPVPVGVVRSSRIGGDDRAVDANVLASVGDVHRHLGEVRGVLGVLAGVQFDHDGSSRSTSAGSQATLPSATPSVDGASQTEVEEQ